MARLYYRLKFLFYAMLPVKWAVERIFSFLFRKGKLGISMESEIYEHRGVMHSIPGIFISALFLSIASSILFLLSSLSMLYSLPVFLGLLFGQLMHLIQDSMTVSGIDWGFPFRRIEEKGTIYTFGKYRGRIDIRPDLFFLLAVCRSCCLCIES